MPRMVITHAVVDIERWLRGKAERARAIGLAGTNVTDYVASDGSHNVAVTVDVHDMAVAEAFLTSPAPDVAAKMQDDGVIFPLMAYVEA